MEFFRDKKINNLLLAIEKSKSRPLSRLIYGLGIRHVGERNAYILAERFRDMEKFAAAGREALEGIEDVGPEVSCAITDYFSLSRTKDLWRA